MQDKKIAFLGGGNMGSAMIERLVIAGWPARQIHVLERSEEKRNALSARWSVIPQEALGGWLAAMDAVVLAVKPQQLPDLLKAAAPYLKNTLIISIAAGVRTDDIERLTGNRRICRVMPNTPVSVGKGVCGVYSRPAAKDDQPLITEILTACGDVIWCAKEAQIEAITAVSGSGPAYVFRFIEALEQSALRYGFTPEQARRLACGTVLGAATLADQSQDSPSQLREKVTSKGGTTFEALKVMDNHDFIALMGQAMDACRARAVELGDDFSASLKS